MTSVPANLTTISVHHHRRVPESNVTFTEQYLKPLPATFMFVHTVFFWLRHPENQDDHTALRAGLESLRQVTDISVVYIGTPAETRRPVIDHTYDFSLTLVFADKAAHDVYQTHPVHLAFVDKCAHLWERVQIYDAVS